MKKFAKRFVALAVSIATLVTLCVSTNALSVSGSFRGTGGYRLTFNMDVTVTDHYGAIYKLETNVREAGSRPYYYPTVYVKSALIGTTSPDSTSDDTFINAIGGTVSVTRGMTDCSGHGYGYFKADGIPAYGKVEGTLSI